MILTSIQKASYFHGRRHGKTLSPQKINALNKYLPLLKLELKEPPPQPFEKIFPEIVEKIVLDIGFGNGENLLHKLKTGPKVGFIGVEPFINGLAKFLTLYEKQQPSALRLYNDDVVPLLEWLPPQTIDQIDLFYPDPWPKRKYWKRRLICPNNLTLFYKVLKKEGLFRFVSDDVSYVEWTIAHCNQTKLFTLQTIEPTDKKTPFPDWISTRYEQKALKAKRSPSYLLFKRN